VRSIIAIVESAISAQVRQETSKNNRVPDIIVAAWRYRRKAKSKALFAWLEKLSTCSV
jgi:hypothetical protein